MNCEVKEVLSVQLAVDERINKGGTVLFARNTEQDYMIRSEKRPGYRSGGGSGKRKNHKRKKKKRASAGYVFLTLLLLVVLFPVGLVMLWMRKIRWSVMSKLILTVIFAAMFVLSTSFLLTVRVENPTAAAIQTGARNGLATMGTNMQEAWQRADVTPERIIKNTQDIVGQTVQLHQRVLAQGFPVLVEKVQGFGEGVQTIAGQVANLAVTGGKGLIDKASSLLPGGPAATALPSVTLLPTPAVTEPIDEPTDAPTDAPTATPTPSAEPTPAVLLAWYGEGDTLYHLDPECKQLLVGTLKSASIAEAVELGLMPCQLCANPDAITPAPSKTPAATELAPTPVPSKAPESSTEPAAPGEWVSFTAEQDRVVSVINDAPAAPSLADQTFEPTPVEPSPDPNAVIIIEPSPTVTPAQSAVPEDDPTAGTSTAAPATTPTTKPTASATPKPTATPTPTPTVKPTPTPSPTPAPLPTIKASGDVKVYYTNGGRFYHVAAECGSMKDAPVHTLSEAIALGTKEPCPYCHAYAKDLAQETDLLWCDTDKVFHTTDECENFKGTPTLKTLAQATEDEDKACTACGADLYAKAE